MAGIRDNITLVTIEPVAGELRPHINEYGVETVQVFDGKQWLEFTQPSYESLLAENQRLRAENTELLRHLEFAGITVERKKQQ